MSKAFEDWFTSLSVYFQYYAEDDSLIEDLKDAYKAGRAYQREVDADTASSMWISTDIDTDETIYSGDVGDAIREQKIDD